MATLADIVRPLKSYSDVTGSPEREPITLSMLHSGHIGVCPTPSLFWYASSVLIFVRTKERDRLQCDGRSLT